MTLTCLRCLVFILGVDCALGQSHADAEDWPQWRGPARTGHVHPDLRIPTNLPPDPKIIWRIPVGDGFASPVVAAGKLFYFDNQSGKETLHALKAEDAKELWRTDIDDTFQDEQGPPGPRCTPVVDGDRIYVQSGKGELACLNIADGRKIWHVNFTNDFGAAFLGEDSKVPGAAEHGYTASPVVAAENLIACVGGTNGAGIICFQKHTGKVVWKSQGDLAAYAAPMLATLGGIEQVVCFTVEGLLGLNPKSGELLWRVPLKTNYGRNCTTPVIVEDWVIAGSYRAGLIGVKVTATSNQSKAEQRWVNQKAAMNFSSPVTVGKFVYGLGPTKNLICVELETGKILWSKEGYFTSSADVAYASLMVFGNNILVSTDSGKLVLMAADSEKFTELGQAQVCGKNWCSPAYAKNRFYIRDGLRAGGNLTCLDLFN